MLKWSQMYAYSHSSCILCLPQGEAVSVHGALDERMLAGSAFYRLYDFRIQTAHITEQAANRQQKSLITWVT